MQVHWKQIWNDYSSKHTHNVLGYAPPLLSPPGIPPLQNVNKLFCFQITFYAILKPLLLNPNDSVVAVTIANETLLSVLFIVFAAITAHILTIYYEQFTVVLTLQGELLQATKRVYLQPPNEIIGSLLSSEIPASTLLKQELNNLPKLIRHSVLHGLVGCILVQWPPDLPDLFLQCCLGCYCQYQLKGS